MNTKFRIFMVGGVVDSLSDVDGFMALEGLTGVPGHPQVWDRSSFRNRSVRNRLLESLYQVREIGKAPYREPPSTGFSTVVMDNCSVQDREPGLLEQPWTSRWD